MYQIGLEPYTLMQAFMCVSPPVNNQNAVVYADVYGVAGALLSVSCRKIPVLGG